MVLEKTRYCSLGSYTYDGSPNLCLQGRIIEACPWSRYYPSSSDSETELGANDYRFSDNVSLKSLQQSTDSDDDDDDDSSEDWDSSLSSESLTEDEETDSLTDSDDEGSLISHDGRQSSSSDSADHATQHAEARLADFVYWNGPMPLTKHELRERKKRDRRKRRIQKAKKVALTTAFVAGTQSASISYVNDRRRIALFQRYQ